MFGPSLLDGSGTTASADSCCLNLVSRPGLPSPAWQQVSPGKNIDFLCAPALFTVWSLVALGFVVLCQLARPHSLIWFVCLRSQVCFRLPPDPASRRRLCLLLTVGATSLRKSLSLSSQCPCWAHRENLRFAQIDNIIYLMAFFPRLVINHRESSSSYQPSLKSSHLGFSLSINAIFFFLIHPLISFSRKIAAETSSVSSKKTNLLTLYFFGESRK